MVVGSVRPSHTGERPRTPSAPLCYWGGVVGAIHPPFHRGVACRGFAVFRTTPHGAFALKGLGHSIPVPYGGFALSPCVRYSSVSSRPSDTGSHVPTFGTCGYADVLARGFACANPLCDTVPHLSVATVGIHADDPRFRWISYVCVAPLRVVVIAKVRNSGVSHTSNP